MYQVGEGGTEANHFVLAPSSKENGKLNHETLFSIFSVIMTDVTRLFAHEHTSRSLLNFENDPFFLKVLNVCDIHLCPELYSECSFFSLFFEILLENSIKIWSVLKVNVLK